METTINTLFPSALDGANGKPAGRDFAYLMTPQCAYEHLLTCYREEVEARLGVFQGTQQILSAIQSTAAWLTDTRRRPWLILGGGLGTGKTTMIRAINRLAKRAQEVCRHGAESASWRGDSELSRQYRAAIHRHRAPAMCTALALANWASNQDEAQIYERAIVEPFLAIDDLGTEPLAIKVFGTEKLPLADLLAARYDKIAPTLITTNLGPAGIFDRYGARIFDRIQEIADTIGFEGASFRAAATPGQ